MKIRRRPPLFMIVILENLFSGSKIFLNQQPEVWKCCPQQNLISLFMKMCLIFISVQDFERTYSTLGLMLWWCLLLDAINSKNHFLYTIFICLHWSELMIQPKYNLVTHIEFFRFWLESNHWIRAGYSEHSLTGRNRKNFLIFSLFSVDCIVYVGPHISIKAFWLVPYFIY